MGICVPCWKHGAVRGERKAGRDGMVQGQQRKPNTSCRREKRKRLGVDGHARECERVVRGPRLECRWDTVPYPPQRLPLGRQPVLPVCEPRIGPSRKQFQKRRVPAHIPSGLKFVLSYRMQNMSEWNNKPTGRWGRRDFLNSVRHAEMFVTLRKGTGGHPIRQPNSMRPNPSRDRVAFDPSVGGALFHWPGALPQMENRKQKGKGDRQ